MGFMGGYRSVALVFLLALMTCVEKQPYSPENRLGKIVGLVKPEGIIIQIELLQGLIIMTTCADSSGYYELDSLAAGSYNIRFSARNYGRQILNEVLVYPGRITTIPDVHLKPWPEQIFSFTPANGTQDFPLTTPIHVEFSVLMDHQSVEKNFMLIPQVSGRFGWEVVSGNSEFSFYPDDQYVSDFSYIMWLKTDARTCYGDSLSFEFVAYFRTEGVKVTTTIPEPGATFIAPQSAIYVYFNSRMDRPSVEQSFSITPIQLGTFKWFDVRRFCFQPGTFLASNTQYTVTIASNARDFYNNFLIKDIYFTFKTEPLRIISSYPNNGATAISRSTPIAITFNTLVNQQTVEEAFTLAPAVEDWNFQWSDLTRFQFVGSTQLQPNTVYTVTIDSTCTDMWQNKLPSTYRYLFTTAN